MANATEQVLTRLKKRDLHKFLERDPRVREWLQEQLVSSAEAGTLLGIERPRVWRWTQAGRITPVATTRATPLFLRCELEAYRDELAAKNGSAA